MTMAATAVDYNRLAATYDHRYAENRYPGLEHTLLEFVGNDPTVTLLEVGCGTGHWLELLSRSGFRVAGVDASPEMLAVARQRLPDARLVSGRAEQLPWPDTSLRRVFCINALHHFTDRRAFLAEARRLLQPGGAFMTIGLDTSSDLDRWWLYDYFAGTREADLARYTSVHQIQRWLEEAGFSNGTTIEAERMTIRVPAREALESGRLAKESTSQLVLLTDEEYQRGIELIRAGIHATEARGKQLELTAELHLFATIGWVHGCWSSNKGQKQWHLKNYPRSLKHASSLPVGSNRSQESLIPGKSL